MGAPIHSTESPSRGEYLKGFHAFTAILQRSNTVFSTHANWPDDCFSFSVHTLKPQQDFSCFEFMGFRVTWETRMVFRHTPLLFPHLSSLSKLLHRTVKHLVLSCDNATQQPLKFNRHKTNMQYSPCEEDARRWSVGDKRLRSAPPASSKTISRPTQMPLNIFAITLSQGLVKLRKN